MSKKRYFVSMVAYSEDTRDKDFFNNIIESDFDNEEITMENIEELQEKYLKMLNEETESKNLYICVQIIGLTLLN